MYALEKRYITDGSNDRVINQMDFDMDNSPESLQSAFDFAYSEAARLGFPAYLKAIEESQPANSAPYVTRLSELPEVFQDTERLRLLNALEVLIARLNDLGNRVHSLLIGGSFLDLRRTPKDLDALVLCESGTSLKPASELVKEARASGLDLRLFPIDGNPTVVVKMVSFFTILYTSDRLDLKRRNGIVLVDCAA